MRISKKAQEELIALQSRTGELHSLTVVNAAMDPDSSLHGYFTWDDTEAARKWRFEEARMIIRAVRIEVQVGESVVKTIGFVRDVRLPNKTEGYVATPKIRKINYKKVIVEEMQRIMSLLSRTRLLIEARPEDLPKGLTADFSRVIDQAVLILDRLA